ncbi:hypothetical protein [Leptospira fletcheri]|uniref:hypothetical protein n=1 Tax=Leptospira fletcheri TaxID=2484981 RepID=UPI001438379E|nr:hypothetical protein [Leptospira fletcheri]
MADKSLSLLKTTLPPKFNWKFPGPPLQPSDVFVCAANEEQEQTTEMKQEKMIRRARIGKLEGKIWKECRYKEVRFLGLAAFRVLLS